MSTVNPISYTSRTFNSVLTDINSDSELADKPDWWKRALAGVMDVLSMMLNAEANNAVLRTAFTRQAVADLLELIDYQITERQTSSGEVLFYVSKDATFPFSVFSADLVGLTEGSLVISAKQFESRSAVEFTEVEEDVIATNFDTSTDSATVTRDYTTGEKVVLTGTDLPVPLEEDTEYWVVRTSATTIRFAESLSDAYNGTYIDLTAQGTSVVEIKLFSQLVQVYQQETKSQQNIGTSDGTEFQEFDLPDLYIVEDTLTITINDDLYERVDSFVDYGPTDKVFKLIYNTDESAKIQFGNDEYGIIPPAFDILADYAVGGGSDSNVTGIGNLSIYSGADSNIEGVSNPNSLTGGSDQQSIETAKVLGPLLLKARNRFITSEDGESLALEYGGFSQVKVNSNAFGVLSAQVLCIASGGGNPDTTTKTELQEYLIARTILESIDVRVEDVTITSIDVTAQGKVLSGYLWADVKPFFDLAWKMFFSEAGEEIVDTYEDSGISDTIDLINSLFGTTFTTDDTDNIQPLVENLNPRQIGEDVNNSDALGFVDSSVVGLDYLTVSSPSFPIPIADDEITTIGTVTSTEIS